MNIEAANDFCTFALLFILKIHKMAIKVLPAFLILTLTWASCQNDAPQTDATQTTPTETPAPEGSASLRPATAAEPANSPMLPSVASGNDAAATPPPATADAAKGSGKVNPPHGQPGHRCDIAVGAPLDGTAPASKPATTATQPAPAGVANAAPTTITPKPAGGATTTTTAPGTNPPHGQPGHRCDIAVGAPLDSKPKQ